MNTRRILLILLALVSAGVASSSAAEDYQQHIRNFAANTPRDKIRVSVQSIKDAGTNAFPTLLAHVQDKAPAEIYFFGGDNALPPTIGDACFDLLQGQIEGNWPKGYRNYYVLSSQSVGDWLSKHKGLPLPQLRIEAAQQSLNRAVADAPKKAKSDWHMKTLKFLRENLEEAKQAAAPK